MDVSDGRIRARPTNVRLFSFPRSVLSQGLQLEVDGVEVSLHLVSDSSADEIYFSCDAGSWKVIFSIARPFLPSHTP